jgi:hypothetical protein
MTMSSTDESASVIPDSAKGRKSNGGSLPGRFADRHLLFGAAFAQLVMRNYPIMVKERPESDNNLFEFSCGGGKALVLFKYSTRVKSPWYFNVASAQSRTVGDSQISIPLERRYLALICHLDGVCLLSHAEYVSISDEKTEQNNLSVSRPESGSYRVSGPGRVPLDRTVARTRWTKEILMR